MRTRVAAGAAGRRAVRAAGAADHAPGAGADDAVGVQVVAALEAAHGAAVPGPKTPSGVRCSARCRRLTRAPWLPCLSGLAAAVAAMGERDERGGEQGQDEARQGEVMVGAPAR